MTAQAPPDEKPRSTFVSVVAWPAIVGGLPARLAAGAYPIRGMSPAEEEARASRMQRSAMYTLLVFAAIDGAIIAKLCSRRIREEFESGE